MSSLTVIHGFKSFKVASTPGSSLNDVLIKTCANFKLKPETHGLKHKNTILDLSLPLRLANLPQGAKLELISKPKGANSSITPQKITIKLQIIAPTDLPTDQFKSSFAPNQLVGNFETSSTLAEILAKFEKELDFPLLELQYSHKKYESQLQILTRVIKKEDYGKKLQDFGYSSNLLIRVQFVEKVSQEERDLRDKRLAQEQEEIRLKQLQNQQELNGRLQQEKEVQEEERLKRIKEFKRAKTVDEDDIEPEQLPKKMEDPMEIDEEKIQPKNVKLPIMKNDSTNNTTPDRTPDITPEIQSDVRKIDVFKPTEQPVESYQPSESTYDLSVSQFKKYHNLIVASAQNKKQVANKPQHVISRYDIRVRFPDQTNLQVNFKPSETIRDLYEVVESMLIKDSIQFKLSLAHPYQELERNSEATFPSSGFESRTLVIFETNPLKFQGPFLKTEGIEVKTIDQAEDARLESQRRYLEDEDDEENESAIDDGKIIKGRLSSTRRGLNSSSTTDGKKVPNWLKFGKK